MINKYIKDPDDDHENDYDSMTMIVMTMVKIVTTITIMVEGLTSLEVNKQRGLRETHTKKGPESPAVPNQMACEQN